MLSSCGVCLAAPWHVGSSQTRGWTCVPYTDRWILNHWTTREVHICVCIYILLLHCAPRFHIWLLSGLTLITLSGKKRHSAHSYMQSYIIPIIVCFSINSFKRVDLKVWFVDSCRSLKHFWDFPGQNYISNNARKLFAFFHSHPQNSVQENFSEASWYVMMSLFY